MENNLPELLACGHRKTSMTMFGCQECFNSWLWELWGTLYQAVNKKSFIYTPGLYRVLHDNEKLVLPSRAKGWKKGKKLRGLPETERTFGGKGTTDLQSQWVKFIKEINKDNSKAWVYMNKLGSGWLNHGPFPKMEQLTFGGNTVNVYEVQGNRAYIDTFYNNETPPALWDWTRVQKFGVVYNDGHWAQGTDTPAGMVFTLLIANKGERLWMNTSDLVKL